MAVNFKDEEEVKKFIANLGIEYRFGCYSEKNPEVCHLLGDYLEAIDKDYTKAAKVYKGNCDEHKYAKSCYKYASYSLLGKGCKRSQERAYDYFERGCNGDHAESCLHQGLLLTRDDDTVLKGMQLLEKACTGKSQNACYYLSGMYISGMRYKVPKDMVQAFRYAEVGCKLGHIYSCVNLSQMYAKGDGVEKNSEQADKYRKIAVEMQEEMQSQKTLEFGQGLKN